MATPKNEATKTEGKPEDKNLPAVTETPEVLAAKAKAAREELLFNTLTSLSDAEDSQWEANGMPNLSYVSSIVGGEPVTMAEVGSVVEDIKDIQRRTVFPEFKDDDEDAPPEVKEATRLARLAARTGKPVVQMDKTVLTVEIVTKDRTRERELNEEILAESRAVASANEALAAKRKERDIITARLASLDSNSHSETVKAYQASEHKVNEQRAADLANYRKLTGGMVPTVGATVADSNRMQRRSLRRRMGA